MDYNTIATSILTCEDGAEINDCGGGAVLGHQHCWSKKPGSSGENRLQSLVRESSGHHS